MVSSGAKMSYERRLWSRQEVSFPYIVVCWSANRILMLSWRGCRTASPCKKHDLGPVALWDNGLREREQSAPWLWKQHLLSGRGNAPRWEMERERWEVFHPPIFNSRDYTSFTLLHSFLFLLGSFHTNNIFLPLFASPLISHLVLISSLDASI